MINTSMTWENYHMSLARTAARKSKDSTKVGAVLVGDEHATLLTSFNGPPIGVLETPERRERPEKYLFASHAEANLVAFAARRGIATKGCTVYVTHFPCAACTRTLVQAGIVCVVTAGDMWVGSTDDDIRAAYAMFREAGVEVRRSTPGV